MAKLRFTDAAIRALPLPGGVNRIDYSVDDVPGFAVMTHKTGTKQFMLVYVAKQSGRERRMVLGRFTPVPIRSIGMGQGAVISDAAERHGVEAATPGRSQIR